MSEQDLYGLTLQQHKEFSRLVIDSRNGTRPAPGVASKARNRQNSAMRVMYVDDGYAIYNPRVPRKVAVFHLNRRAQTRVIEMTGQNLNGPIIVNINGLEYIAECRSNTAMLRAIFADWLPFCRITAFPGMWEFAWSGDAPFMSVRAGTVSSTGSFGYLGGLLIIDEAWVSEDNGRGGVVMIDATDAMPFLEGEVRRGARAIAQWSRDDGWLVGPWQCRPFSFRADWAFSTSFQNNGESVTVIGPDPTEPDPGENQDPGNTESPPDPGDP